MTIRVGAGLVVGILTVLGSAVPALAGPVTLKVGELQLEPGAAQVSVEAAGAQGLGGAQFVIRYDPELLEIKAAEVGPLVVGGNVDLKIREPGVARVALVADEGVSGSGSLVVLQVEVKGRPGGTCPLTLTEARAYTWDDSPPLRMDVVVEDGALTVAGEAEAGPAEAELDFNQLRMLVIGALVVFVLSCLAGIVFVMRRSRRKPG